MDTEQIKEKVISVFPDVAPEDQKEFPTLLVPVEKLHDVAVYLRNEEELLMDFLFCMTGMDWGKELGVVYHLRSTRINHSVVLKVSTADRETPVFPTVSDIWKTADFQEREIFDLLGIRFENHPDMRRIFLEESWKGYPLRKDYQDQVNLVEF